jgi:hypothetical protein
MQDDEAVVAVVVVEDVLADPLPVGRGHVRGIEQGSQLVDHVVRQIRARQHLVGAHLLLEEAGRRHVAVGRPLHADGAAGIDDVHPRVVAISGCGGG